MERRKIDGDTHFVRFESSAQKASDYCRAQSLNLGTFRHNLYKYRARQKQGSAFSEIMVNTEISLSCQVPMSLKVNLISNYAVAIERVSINQ